MLACASGEQFACWPVSYGDNLHADLRNKGHIGTADEKLDPWVRTGGSHARRGDGRAVPARPRGGDGVRRGGRVRRGRPPPDRREVGRRAAAALRSRRALQMARLGRAVPREPPGEEHVPQGQELRQRPHGGLLRHAQVGVLPQPGLGGGSTGTAPWSSCTAGSSGSGRAACRSRSAGGRRTGTAGSWATRCRMYGKTSAVPERLHMQPIKSPSRVVAARIFCWIYQ